MSERKNDEILRLVDGCRKGNHRAQRGLFKRFYSPMFYVCMRYAGSREEAEDMLNEGFLKVFSNLDKYEDTGSFESWMKRVMINAALDYRRRFSAKVETTELDETMENAATGFDVNSAIGKMSADEVVALIQQLPPMTRTVFNLFVFEDFSHREIAEQLNISEGTSAWHVNTARTRLKTEMMNINR